MTLQLIMKRNEVNICLRKAKSKYYQYLMDGNIRSFDHRSWKVIKRIYPAKNKQSLRYLAKGSRM